MSGQDVKLGVGAAPSAPLAPAAPVAGAGSAQSLGGALPSLIVWIVLLSAPAWLNYVGGYTALASHVVVMGLVAMALNFLLGFTGVMSFGHAAYFGLGAYGTGLTLRYLSNSTGLAMIDGILLGGVIGTALGALICKRRGVYFAMITIAFGQIFYYIAYTWDSFTGGFDGLRGFTRQPIDLGFATIDIQNGSTAFYYFVLFVFAISVGLMALLLRSPFGRTLIAIRENQRRARFLGIAVDRHIWLSFSISCFFASTAGALYALLNNFADPTSLHYTLSGVIVIMVVMGGMRSFWGPLVGAAIYVVLQDYISSMTQNWMSFIGLIFVLVVMFCPRGILGILKTRSST
jgi:branched-chain amino acid transport system permease protein